MSMMNLNNLQFESQNDVIDYVTKGLPPKKKDFETLMDAVATHDPSDVDPSRHVIIAPGVEFDMDEDALINAMRRVYKNRCHNRNILIGAGIIIGGVVLFHATTEHNKVKDLKAENEKLTQIIEDDLPVAHIDSM